jgi:hypothetical protein
MNPGTVVLLLSMALVLFGAVHTYERLLAQTRAERDDLLDILDGTVDDMRRLAQERHPSARQYGGGNLRLISGGER